MKKSRFTEEQIVYALNLVWLVGGDMPLIEVALRRAWKLTPKRIVVVNDLQTALVRELVLLKFQGALSVTDKRKKLTVYLHPEDDSQDARAMEIIESVPLRTRGDFFRAAIVGGSVLYQLDKRLPYLLSMLFDGQLTADSWWVLFSKRRDGSPRRPAFRTSLPPALARCLPLQCSRNPPGVRKGKGKPELISSAC
ncbi:plasmid partitioning/stability family protein [Rahnella sp. WP5]|uniref:plasmid partitioning/stability family protein n=1 Tax=Rahnella sp. WP5 TaxID=1500266 RepID=UPI00068E6DE8|nr:plasmid partitioning/stability family protein [Rahnella sp. WP5]